MVVLGIEVVKMMITMTTILFALVKEGAQGVLAMTYLLCCNSYNILKKMRKRARGQRRNGVGLSSRRRLALNPEGETVVFDNVNTEEPED